MGAFTFRGSFFIQKFLFYSHKKLRMCDVSPLVGAYDGDSPPSYAQLACLPLYSSPPRYHHNDDADHDVMVMMS